jgi:hypothetical protein
LFHYHLFQAVILFVFSPFHLKDMSVPLQTPSKNVEQWNWAQMYKIPLDILDDLCRLVALFVVVI